MTHKIGLTFAGATALAALRYVTVVPQPSAVLLIVGHGLLLAALAGAAMALLWKH
jgi:hypothetical protein